MSIVAQSFSTSSYLTSMSSCDIKNKRGKYVQPQIDTTISNMKAFEGKKI